MAITSPSKLMMRVWFPLPAPAFETTLLYYGTGVFFYYVGAGCFEKHSVLWLWFEAGCSLSADFLRQQNGALSVEILYFLAGSVGIILVL